MKKSSRVDGRLQIEAVVFDMDGLMFNTEDLYNQVGSMLLSRRGHQFSLELKLKMMGLPGPDAFTVLKNELGLPDSIDTLQRESDQIFHELLPNEIATMPGLFPLLEFLENHSIPKAIATSSHRPFATRALGYFDLEPRFEFLLTAEDVTRGKPDPEIYYGAAKRLGVEPQQMLVLEDSLAGARAAVAAGAVTIAVPTQYTRGMEFGDVWAVADSLADPVIHKLIRKSEKA